VGEEGIEFEYEFHGKRRSPPMKYLSESHLNSLGICLFQTGRRAGRRELYPNVVDGREEEGGIPSRLIKIDAGDAGKRRAHHA
jgi:hypothetical protein